MNATEPSIKCHSGIPHGTLLLQRRSRNMGNRYGMVLLCWLLRPMVKWSQGLAAPKTTRQLLKIQ